MPDASVPLVSLFVGPIAFMFGVVLIVAIVFVVVRVLLGLAWRIAILAAVILVLLWALGVLGTGPPREINPLEAAAFVRPIM